MKKFTIILLFIVFIKGVLLGQGATATLTNVSITPGQPFSMPLMVTNFNNISSITFIIKFDPTSVTPILNSQGKLLLTNIPFGYNLSNFVGFIHNNKEIIITFTDPNTFSIVNGKLFDLNFSSYCGTIPTNIEFLSGCEVDSGIPPVILPIIYSNGQISNIFPTATSEIGNLIYSQLQNSISVPVTYTGFSNNLGSFEQHIKFDDSKLTFVNATGTGNLSNGMLAYANNGVITLIWTNTNLVSINLSTISLNFGIIGSGNSTLSFVPCCLFSDLTGNTYYSVNSINGSVSETNPVAFVSLGNLNNVIQAQDYEIPLMLNNFPYGMPNGLGSYTLNINFDNKKLSFIGVTNNIYSALINQNASNINIVWSNNISPNINGQVLKLKFKYNGIGSTNINFLPSCSFSSTQSNLINVGYTNSIITPINSTNIATIESVQGTIGTNVLIPLDFSGLPSNMGAVTLNIDYDHSKLYFIDAQNNIHNATVFLNPTSQKIQIAWSSPSATDINGTFLKLRFAYIGGGSSLGSNITFETGCELADISSNIIPSNWIDGGVNLKFKISGLLNYNSDPSPLIPLVGYTVYLKVNLNNNIIDSTITDANGYYEFFAPNGSYLLDAKAPNTANWYADLDDVLALWDYTLGNSLPYENTLRLLAGDVTQNFLNGGGIDLGSILALWDRTLGVLDPEYTAPDFVFENPIVTINNSSVTNTNFMGLCSGNVLGSNPNP